MLTDSAMHIRDILTPGRTSISFEFFPPRTEAAAEDLRRTMDRLAPFAPSFVSVTYGAGGGTRGLTRDLVLRLRKEGPFDPIPHLTCVGHSRAEVQELLEAYAAAGVGNILALRGDTPRDGRGVASEFMHAADLVRTIRSFRGHPDPRGFGIGVAGFPEGHPDTPNRLVEMDHLKAKVDAGADWICTQLFFDNRDFLDFRDRCALAGIDAPILAGILPLTSLDMARRIAGLAGGARFPAPLLKAFQDAGADTEAAREAGVRHATGQCRDLLRQGVAGIHFYTLNRPDAVVRICEDLGADLNSPAAKLTCPQPAGTAMAEAIS